jgi:hypothetical protein
MKTIDIKLARKEGMPLSAIIRSVKLFGMLPIEITSIVVAKANAASINVSSRVASKPLNRKFFTTGKDSISSILDIILFCY